MMKRIPLTQGRHAIVDAEDFGRLSRHNWCLHPGRKGVFYAKRKVVVDGRAVTVLMHHEVLGVQGGCEVDHINHDGLNNTRANLRHATRQENLRNKRPYKRRKDALGPSSRYKGVKWRSDRRKWRAQITASDGQRSLGHFDAEVEAALAYDEAARKHFGEFAYLNFPGRATAGAVGHTEPR